MALRLYVASAGATFAIAVAAVIAPRDAPAEAGTEESAAATHAPQEATPAAVAVEPAAVEPSAGEAPAAGSPSAEAKPAEPASAETPLSDPVASGAPRSSPVDAAAEATTETVPEAVRAEQSPSAASDVDQSLAAPADARADATPAPPPPPAAAAGTPQGESYPPAAATVAPPEAVPQDAANSPPDATADAETREPAAAGSALEDPVASGAAGPGARDERAAPDDRASSQPRAGTTIDRASLLPLAQPLWSELSTEHRRILAPFAEQWNALPLTEKLAWVDVANTFPRLSAAQRQRAQQRIREWAALTPEQRRLARANYRLAKQLPKEERVAEWESYRSLTDEQRAVIGAAGRTSNTAAGHAGAPTGLARHAAQPLPREEQPERQSLLERIRSLLSGGGK